MAKADLSLISVLDPANAATLTGYNFQRLDLLSEVEKDIVSEIVVVTGSLTINTGLSSAEGVVAILAAPPVAGACFVSATVVADSNNIIISVWSNAFAASIIAVSIQYIAVGVMSL